MSVAFSPTVLPIMEATGLQITWRNRRPTELINAGPSKRVPTADVDCHVPVIALSLHECVRGGFLNVEEAGRAIRYAVDGRRTRELRLILFRKSSAHF